jgi:long-chain acyl-CoA synthetase
MIKENFILYYETAIKEFWNDEALSDYKGENFTYSQVADQIARLHILFERNGVKEGDKIALIGKNSANWAIVYLSVVTYGAVIVPILPEFKTDDIHHIVNHSDSILFFTGDQAFQTLNPEQMPLLQAILSVTDFMPKFSRSNNWTEDCPNIDSLFQQKYPDGLTPEKIKFRSVSNNNLAVISYTSGTTGFSKGVMLTHNSLAANIRFARNNMPLTAGDKIVSFLPLAHAYGVAFEFLFPFSLGCHITFLTKSPSPQIVMQAFSEIRPRLILSVPLIIEKIYKKQLLPIISKPAMKILLNIPLVNRFLFKKIRQKLCEVFGGNFHEVVVGGAAFNFQAEAFLRKIKFPITIGYGMTECGPLISYSAWNSTKLYSAGKSVDSLEVKIDSFDPYSIVGEILVKGENVMLGYYKNTEATKAAIDEDGWLHTGDQGIIDKEGNIYIKGRSKTMILGSSGQNIYPEEIESLLGNKDGIGEALIIEDKGHLVALIYPDYDYLESNQLSAGNLRELYDGYILDINRRLPTFMNVARYVIHTTEFEKTPKRSIKRFLYTVKEY